MDPMQSQLVLTQTFDFVPDPTTGMLKLVLAAQSVEIEPKVAIPVEAAVRRPRTPPS